jgi:nucleoside 2-deoxyribosyltransferase
MIVHRYESTQQEVNDTKGPVVFLAGPTVRGHQPHLISWRAEAIKIFKNLEFSGSLIVPEFTSKTESDKGRNDIPLWENNGLRRADVLLFWIPRTRELIGLTTNFELGYWFAKRPENIVLGFPPLGSENSYRNNYIDIMMRQYALENGKEFVIHDTLQETIEAAIVKSFANFSLIV